MTWDTLWTWLTAPPGLVVLVALGAFLVLIAALFYAPAKTTILLDTPTSTARADMRLLFGLGPRISTRLFPRESAGAPLEPFNDAVRVGNALITPGIADVTVTALRELLALKPRTAQAALAVNTGDSARDLVIETAVKAALTLAPASVAKMCAFSRSTALGAELSAKFEVSASPMRLAGIWNRLRRSRAAREFAKRLRRRPKPVKKPVREVRTA